MYNVKNPANLQAEGPRFESVSAHKKVNFIGERLKMYSVYIIYSQTKNLHYIGHTSNLHDRIKRHNSNRNIYTKNKGPWELIISFPCNTKSEAYRLELKLKAMKNSDKAIQYLEKLVQSTPTT